MGDKLKSSDLDKHPVICQNWSHSLLREAGVCSMAMSVRDRQDLEELLGLGGSK